MTPEEELRRLNRLIRQYQTVWRTTADPDQKERAAREIRELRSYRDKILAVNVIDRRQLEEPAVVDEPLADWPVLSGLAADAAESGDADREVFHISLYITHFEREYLPLLTETRLKCDFKHSMERDGFYQRFQDLRRKLEDWREAHRRLDDGGYNRDLENEIRTRTFKLKRILSVEANRFFRAIGRFCSTLVKDARSDGVLCLNGTASIAFDRIEGERMLAGRSVVEGLESLAVLADEVVAYLGIPDMDGQENDRADRR